MIAQSLSSCHFDSPRAWFSCHSRKLLLGHIQLYPCDAVVFSSQIGCQKLASLRHSGHNCVLASGKYPRNPLIQRCSTWRTFAMSIDLEDGTSVEPQGDDSTNTDESILEDSTQTLLSEPPDSNVLKSLLVDAERSKLMKKLSEANQYNRFLKRQLQFEEDALINFKSELAILELELQTLIGLAEEIAQSGIQQDLRKINGKYIPSYLLSRLEGFHDKIKEQIEGVEAIELKEIELSWHGMAETVQVMGSFDGWSEGEYMSSEYSGGFAKFTATLRLRPGKYEIKFLVDGEWHLSPEFPITGEGMMQNNLLIVE